MRFHTFMATLALVVASLFSAAQAAPITYTLSGTISGSFDLQPFSNAAFTWTITGDTTQKQMLATGFSGVPAQTSLLDIAGVGSSLAPAEQIFAVPGAPAFSTFAFADTDEVDGIGFAAPELGSYDGVSSLSPIAVTLNGTSLFTTTQGTVFFETGSDMTFQAVATPEPSVPEPITLPLFAGGLAGFGVLRRRKQKA